MSSYATGEFVIFRGRNFAAYLIGIAAGGVVGVIDGCLAGIAVFSVITGNRGAACES